MPSIAVHLTIASHLADRLGIRDLSAYFLGNIAPDSVNAYGFASKEARYGAHIRSRSYTQWKQNIKDFISEHEEDYKDSPDFFKGVLLHLYTDIAWDEAVQPALFDHLRECGFSEAELNDRKWDELRGFDSLLSQNSEYTEAIKHLKNAKPTSVTTVTPELMAKWQEMIIALEYPYPPAKFLSSRHILDAEAAAFGYMTAI